MNVMVTTFSNPFSFFCTPKNYFGNDVIKLEGINKLELTENIKTEQLQHGQYVAVMWANKWIRGLIDMKENLMIWLIDLGIYFRPSETTLYFNLPPKYKKLPSRVFEASIHGVIPVKKSVNDDMESIKIEHTFEWNLGAIAKAKELIASAKQIHFKPVALLSLNYNDVVIGHLHLTILDKGTVNLADELAELPIFLQKNAELYLKNLTKLYRTRKMHRACREQPKLFHELRILRVDSTLLQYNEILKTATEPDSSSSSSFTEDSDDETAVGNHEQLHMSSLRNNDDDVSTTVTGNGIEECLVELTVEEKERYATMTLDVNGEKQNALFVLQNKIRDLNMCEKYRKYEGRSFGRGYTKRR